MHSRTGNHNSTVKKRVGHLFLALQLGTHSPGNSVSNKQGICDVISLYILITSWVVPALCTSTSEGEYTEPNSSDSTMLPWWSCYLEIPVPLEATRY